MRKGSMCSRPGDLLVDGKLVAKTCTKCKRVLPLDSYHAQGQLVRKRADCKDCYAARAKAARDADIDRSRAAVRESYAKHIGKRRETARRYAADPAVKERRKQYDREYYQRNKAKLLQADAVYRRENRRKINARQSAYNRRRRTEDEQFRIALKLRGSVNDRIKRWGATKGDRSWALIGCSVEWLKVHIESLWQPGMSWDNHGVWKCEGPPKWHLDHIRPVASFDLTNPEEQKRCFHWTNLQPLWAEENLAKGVSHAEERQASA